MFLSWLLASVFMFAALLNPNATVRADFYGQTQAMDERDVFDQMLDLLRQELFNPMTPAVEFLWTQIIIDDSEFEYSSPPPDMTPYLIPIDEGYIGIMPYFMPEVYLVGSRRQFNASGKTPTFGHWGELVRQGNYVNIWVFDAVVNRPSEAALDAAIIQFDDITYRMTRDIAPFRDVRMVAPFSNMSLVGDVHNDGRVNIVIHEGSTGGYFWVRNFMTSDGNVPIAMFQLHPNNFNAVNANPGLTFAHELQHLLFDMHFRVFASENQPFQWINEALSDLSTVFWTVEGAEMVSTGRVFSASENSYANPNDVRVGDFLNFNNSSKNYGISRVHGVLMHRLTNGAYMRAVYDFLRASFPPSTTYAEFWDNRARLDAAGMVQIVGDAFHAAGLTGSTGASGELAFNLLYFLFMENFAADGGNVMVGNTAHPTTKFVASPFSAHNLWGVRPNLGITSTGNWLDGAWGHNGVFQDDTSGFFNLGTRTAFPLLFSGDSVSLTGFNGTPPLGASQDRFYRLTGESVGNPILSISINDNSPMTQYYIVIPNDPVGAVSHSLNRQMGSAGATVHPLTRNNVVNHIDTGGQVAYLFVATLYRNVSAVVTYSWSDQAVLPIGITVLNQPTTLEYIAGQQLNLAGLTVRITYSDSSTRDVAYVDFADNNISTNPAGGTVLAVATHHNMPVTVTLGAFNSTTNNLIVTTPIPTGIAVFNQPTNLEYVEGNQLNLAGLIVRITYNNSLTRDVAFADFAANNITTIPANGTVLSVAAHNGNPVTVMHGTFNGNTNNLTVTTPVPTGIGVFAQPSNLAYVEGNQLNLAGLVVRITYNNSTSRDVAYEDFAANNITTSPASGAVLTVSAHNASPVTVTFGVFSGTTNNLTVTAPVPTGIEVINQPTRLEYVEVHQLNLAGLEIRITYNNSTTRNVVYADFAANNITTSPASGTALAVIPHHGTPVTVTLGGFNDTTDNLTVTTPVPVGIEVFAQPLNLIYDDGQHLNLTGLVARITYNNSVTRDVAYIDFAANNIVTSPASGTVLAVTPHHDTAVTVVFGAFNDTTKALTVLPVITSVIVAHELDFMLTGQTQQFTATVLQIESSQSVTWSIEGNVDIGTAISENGLLTVAWSQTPGTLTIRATSTVDTAVSGIATLTVVVPHNTDEEDDDRFRTQYVAVYVPGDRVDTDTYDAEEQEYQHITTAIADTVPFPFIDVESEVWYRLYVEAVWRNHLFQGTSAYLFNPQGNMTRAMFVQVLANLQDADLSGYQNITPTFYDVPNDAWYFSVVEWAVSVGIVSGVADGIFSPNSPIYREQMAVMLHRFIEANEIVLPVYEVIPFTDYAYVSPWAQNAILAVQQAGIITGRLDGYFDLNATASRAEVSAIFARFLNIVQ